MGVIGYRLYHIVTGHKWSGSDSDQHRCPVRNGPFKPEDSWLLRNFLICSMVRIRGPFPSLLNSVTNKAFIRVLMFGTGPCNHASPYYEGKHRFVTSWFRDIGQ